MSLSAPYTIERASRIFGLALPFTAFEAETDSFASPWCVVWSPEADALIAQYDLTPDERVGAIEAAEEVAYQAGLAELEHGNESARERADFWREFRRDEEAFAAE